MRRTKIVATLGPASDRPGVLRKLLESGVDVCRLNFSHGGADDHRRRAREVREIAKDIGRTVAILADLQGPKIRIARFKDQAVQLKVGAQFVLDAQLGSTDGDETKVGLDYRELPKDSNPGDVLLLDDGRVVLRVTEVKGSQVVTEVMTGGKLSNNKGINKQGGGLSASALTDKDFSDMDVVAEIDADYVAISFPRDAEDIHFARAALRDRGSSADLVAKIERAEAVASDTALDALISASDAVMVARGDLGVEIGDDRLIGVQKKIIARARALDRPVITATQMMESMISNSMPTRAEVFDVANAVLDGTDAVMLSAETAAGDYPVETVLAMAKTAEGAEQTEQAQALGTRVEAQYGRRDEAIALGAMYIANHLKNLAAIVCITESGSTPLWMSRSGASLPIVALSVQPKTLARMALFRGVIPLAFDAPADQPMSVVDQVVVGQVAESLQLPEDSQVLLTRGDRLNNPGGTSTLKIVSIEEAKRIKMVIESKIPKEAEIPPTDFVIVGGTGDLALRKIFPALFHRFLDGQIPQSCALIAAARHPLPKDEFLAQLQPFCDEAIRNDNEADWLAFGDRVQIIGFDVITGEGAEEIEAACLATEAVPRVFYFAISPTLFAGACQTLERTGLKTEQTRLVVEKPMGHDLKSAEALDDSILAVFEERQIYRIDHYLGKETVQNLMALRFANSIFESLWSNAHIDHVQISVAEAVGVGSRESYYDEFGALRDMIQNHLLQLLCLVAMEPPSKFVADQVRDEKLRVLRALKPITRDNYDRCVKLGQYSKGSIEAKPVDSYANEVGRASRTETFAALRCEISNWRWSGVPFYLRTGKRLAGRASEIVVTFKRPPHNIFEDGPRSSEVMEPNRLVIRLQPNEGLKLCMTSKEPGPGGMRLFPASLNLSFNETFKTRLPEAYERLLMDVARGNQTLFMRSDEVEAAWAFIDPIVNEAKLRQPEKYTAGTWGPVSSFELMAEHGHRWIEPEVD